MGLLLEEAGNYEHQMVPLTGSFMSHSGFSPLKFSHTAYNRIRHNIWLKVKQEHCREETPECVGEQRSAIHLSWAGTS